MVVITCDSSVRVFCYHFHMPGFIYFTDLSYLHCISSHCNFFTQHMFNTFYKDRVFSYFLRNFFQGKCQRKEPPCKYLHPPQHLREQLLQNGRNNLILKNLQLQAAQQAALNQGIMPNLIPIVSIKNSNDRQSKIVLNVSAWLKLKIRYSCVYSPLFLCKNYV